MQIPKMLASLRGIKTSRAGLLVAALPGLAMLGLFYSLALHMRLRLGAWPQSIGENGFPPALVTHCHVTWRCCEALVLLGVFILPAVILVCALVPRWRWLTAYLAFGAFLFLACWGLMLLAPASFLNWWWD